MLLKAIQKFFENYQRKMRRWEKHHPVLNTLIVLVAVVMLWRGIWGLLDIYLFPGNPFMSNLVSVIIGFIILLLDDFELDEI